MRHLKNSKPTMASRLAADSLRPRPDDGFVEDGMANLMADLTRTPMDEINLMISLGWGDVAQCDLPNDWRTRRNPKG